MSITVPPSSFAQVLSRSVRSTAEVFVDTGAMLWPAMRSAIDELPEPVRSTTYAHFSWQEGSPAPVAGGKALRPTLTLLCSQAFGESYSVALPAAVAIELIHNASMMHDDVIDGDQLRRGRPALWVSHGIPAAILTGNSLFFLAMQLLTRAGGRLQCPGVELLTTAVQDIIGRGCNDSLSGDQTEVSLSASQVAAPAVTGSLIAMACRLGALAAGADWRRAEHLAAFGALLGEAFQAVGDLLGIWGDPARTGKPVGSDLHARKKSLPVALALASSTAAGQELAKLYGNRMTPLTQDEAARAALLVDEAGGREATERRVAQCTRRALDHLASAQPDPAVELELAGLAHLLVRRDH